MQSEYEINRVVNEYADMIRRICFYRLKNHADTEDVFQNVFLKYLLYEGKFENADHEKAWFVRVSINACKDYLKSLFRHRTVPLEALAEEEAGIGAEQYGVLEALLELPAKYKDVLYLHYFEGYSALEISGILKKKENTVYSLLSRGRGMLKERLGGEEFGEPGL
ncbi:MAG: RNA polymerase sigma factor [Lachnospiraceae bacterium]|nr:RNA polymerase sigma factor [Lachnospiraceae bacterium]